MEIIIGIEGEELYAVFPPEANATFIATVLRRMAENIFDDVFEAFCLLHPGEENDKEKMKEFVLSTKFEDLGTYVDDEETPAKEIKPETPKKKTRRRRNPHLNT